MLWVTSLAASLRGLEKGLDLAVIAASVTARIVKSGKRYDLDIIFVSVYV